jgi:hypothetical protein
MERQRATPSDAFLLEMKKEIMEVHNTFNHESLDEEGLIKEDYFLASRKIFYKFHE